MHFSGLKTNDIPNRFVDSLAHKPRLLKQKASGISTARIRTLIRKRFKSSMPELYSLVSGVLQLNKCCLCSWLCQK